MARKYLRGLQYTTGTNGRDIPIFMRFCYEFWGYSVNANPILQISAATNATPIQITTTTPHGLVSNQLVGISGVLGNTAANGQFSITVLNTTQFTLTSSVGSGTYTGDGKVCVPGGMPVTPVSAAPAGFFEGTSVVLTTGTDGVTSDLGINFTSLSANFSQTLVNKHITIWSSSLAPGLDGYESTDNSIYRIINVISSTQLIIAPFSGGTPDITTMKNNLRSRSFLNYRIIDVIAASQLAGLAVDNYFVGTLSDGYTINTGQANSQFQFKLKGASQPFGQFNIVGSPNGSWNGSTFVSAAGTSSATLTEQTLPATNFTGTTSGAIGVVTLIADKTFFLGHIRSPNSNATAGEYFYIIIPQRLYTQAQDPNPLTIYIGGNNLLATNVADSHSTKFNMVNFDGTTRISQLMTKSFVGDPSSGPQGTTGFIYTLGPNLSPLLATQNRIGRALYTEAIISNIALTGQYALARCKMKQIAFTSNIFGSFLLFGDNGEFIHVGNGILWPWDGSVMPYSLLPLGT